MVRTPSAVLTPRRYHHLGFDYTVDQEPPDGDQQRKRPIRIAIALRYGKLSSEGLPSLRPRASTVPLRSCLMLRFALWLGVPLQATIAVLAAREGAAVLSGASGGAFVAARPAALEGRTGLNPLHAISLLSRAVILRLALKLAVSGSFLEVFGTSTPLDFRQRRCPASRCGDPVKRSQPCWRTHASR